MSDAADAAYRRMMEAAAEGLVVMAEERAKLIQETIGYSPDIDLRSFVLGVVFADAPVEVLGDQRIADVAEIFDAAIARRSLEGVSFDDLPVTEEKNTDGALSKPPSLSATTRPARCTRKSQK